MSVLKTIATSSVSLRIARQQTEVGVDARGARVIIAGAEMDVTPEPIGIAPNDEQRFAMRLQSDHAVDDVRAGFLEAASPLNVGRFIETRAQFHDGRDLFAGGGGVDQRFDDGRIAARAIKRDLDREHLRIAARRSRSTRRSDRSCRRDDAAKRPVRRITSKHVGVRRQRRIASPAETAGLSDWQTRRWSPAA